MNHLVPSLSIETAPDPVTQNGHDPVPRLHHQDRLDPVYRLQIQNGPDPGIRVGYHSGPDPGTRVGHHHGYDPVSRIGHHNEPDSEGIERSTDEVETVSRSPTRGQNRQREAVIEESQNGRTAYRYSAKPVLNIDTGYQPKPVLGIDTGYQQEWNGLHIPYRDLRSPALSVATESTYLSSGPPPGYPGLTSNRHSGVPFYPDPPPEYESLKDLDIPVVVPESELQQQRLIAVLVLLCMILFSISAGLAWKHMEIILRRKEDDDLSEEVFTERTQQNIYDNESYNFTEDTIN